MRRLMISAVLCISTSMLGMSASEAATPAVGLAFADECGPDLPKPTGGTWDCTFVDNFSGTALNRGNWTPQVNFHSGLAATRRGACMVDDPNNVRVLSGNLQLTVRKVSRLVRCDGYSAYYTSGGVTTHDLFSQQYGRFEARIKPHPSTKPGLQEAFWMLPSGPPTATWPANGEIDVSETYSQYSTLSVPFLHYTYNNNGGPVPGLNTAWNCVANRGVYNTYTLTWSATKIAIDVNGKSCLVNTSGNVAFKKSYFMSLSSLLGVTSNALTTATPIPATMMVDYVKVWK